MRDSLFCVVRRAEGAALQQALSDLTNQLGRATQLAQSLQVQQAESEKNSYQSTSDPQLLLTMMSCHRISDWSARWKVTPTHLIGPAGCQRVVHLDDT